MGFFAFSVFIGPLLFIIGVGYLINKIVFIRSSKIIEGKIIEIREGYVNNRKSYFPIVEYRNEEGKIRSYESNTGYWKSRFKKGDLIELRYIRYKTKDEVCLNKFFALYGFSLLFIPIGLLFGTLGILGIIYIKV